MVAQSQVFCLSDTVDATLAPVSTRFMALSKIKTLCDWSKNDLKDRAGELAQLVHEANFYCTKCARVANDRRALCKARKLPTGKAK